MGNNVCCDKNPFSIADIIQTKDTFSSRRIVQEQILSTAARDSFAPYEHNLKVFAISEPTGFPTARDTKPTPVNLSGMYVVDPTLSYVVLDVKRISAKTSTTLPSDLSEQAPRWSVDSFVALTPRGLGCTFAFDFGNLFLRSAPSADERFSFSIFVFKGRLSSATTGAAATMVGMSLERLVMCDVELITRLFYSYNVNRQQEAGQVCAMGVVDFSDPRVDRSFVPRLVDLQSMLAKNALLRTLCNHTEAEKNASTPARRELIDRSSALSSSPQPVTASPATRSHYDPALQPEIQITRRLPTSESDSLTAAPPPPVPSVQPQMPKLALGPSTTISAFAVLPVSAVAIRDGGAAEAAEENDDETDETKMSLAKMNRLKQMEPLVTEVLPHVFVGGEVAARDLQQLQRLGVTHVINAAAVALEDFFPSHFSYLNLFLCDSPDEPIYALFPVIINLIDEVEKGGGKIFVHCHQGVSRSCSLVISYVMWRKGLSYHEAYCFVREYRTICSPNPGFIVNLMRFQNQLENREEKSFLWCYQPYTAAHKAPLVFQGIPLSRPELFLDPRTCYGCIAHRDGGIDVYFSAGKLVSNAVASAAATQFEHHVRSSFYIGQIEQKSKTYKGDEIVMRPSTAHRRRVTKLSHEELAVVLQEAAAEAHVPIAAIAVSNDASLDSLLDAGLDEVLFSPVAAVEQRETDETSSLLPLPVSSPGAVPSTASSVQDLSVRDDDSEPEEGQDSVLVYQFPFRRDDDKVEVIGIEDLDSSLAYAIVLRGYRASHRPHHVFLWIGEDFTKSDEEVEQAYEANLVNTGLRITSRTQLADVPPKQVLEGTEPDELLLAFA